jgi:hypothetical protein
VQKISKTLVFDSGPVISFALNGILNTFMGLKEKFNGDFLMPPAIKKELIERPLESKKFKFEAHQVSWLLKEGVFKIYDNPEIIDISDKLLNLANNIFIAQNNSITIVHEGEMHVLACAILNSTQAVVIDERTTRYLVEEPKSLHALLENKLHMQVVVDKKKLKEFSELVNGIKVIRSVELATIAFELGLFDKYLLNIENNRKELLDSILWGIKLNGCAVREEEIDYILKNEV